MPRGAVVCLPDYLSNAQFSTNNDPEIPLPGEAFFYLYPVCEDPQPCSYGETSAGDARWPTSGACAEESARAGPGSGLKGRPCRSSVRGDCASLQVGQP